MGVTVSYNGADIATLTESGTATLATDNKFCVDDISINYVGSGAKWNDVNFWDYNGELLFSYSASEFANLSSLPPNPSHPRLTSQGWNWSLIGAKTHVATYGFLDIGQLYTPSSGNTEFLVNILTTDEMYVWLNKSSTTVASIDWGDGSSETLSTNGSYKYTHTYSVPGEYIISIIVTSGKIQLYGAWDTNFIGPMSKAPVNARLLEAHFNNDVEPGTYTMNAHPSLKAITLSSDYSYGCSFENCPMVPIIIGTPSSIGTYGSRYWYSMKAICLPEREEVRVYLRDNVSLQRLACKGILTISSASALSGCRALKRIGAALNSSMSVDHTFQYCYSLEQISLPNGLTALGGGMFESVYTLRSLTIPSTITSIASYCFSSSSGIKEFHFLPTTPPELADTNAFYQISSDCVFYVPYSEDHSILEAYQTATNWSSFADRMVEELQ